MKNSIIADTGFWYALICQDDGFHQRALDTMRELNAPLICTWPVISETCYLLQARVSSQAAFEFLSSCNEGFYEVYPIKAEQIHRLVILMQKYADLPMDLADASLVLLAEELGHGRILSTDRRDFNMYRWKNHKPFQNLLLPDD
jgi:predicted nucleic acid-binding protein